MREMTDAELVEIIVDTRQACSARDPAFAEIYRRYRDRLEAWIRKYGPKADAEAIAQEVLLLFWRTGAYQLRDKSKVSTVLFRAARCLAISWFRSTEKRRVEGIPWSTLEAQEDGHLDFESSTSSAQQTLEGTEAIDLLNTAIDNLPERSRTVVKLLDIEQMSHGAAAAALGVSVGTIRSRLYSGRRQLREAMLRNYLHILSEEHRGPIVLIDLEHKTPAEAAETVGIPVDTLLERHLSAWQILKKMDILGHASAEMADQTTASARGLSPPAEGFALDTGFLGDTDRSES